VAYVPGGINLTPPQGTKTKNYSGLLDDTVDAAHDVAPNCGMVNE
jgi:hypothetical protein